MFSMEVLYRAGFSIGGLSLLIFFLGHMGLLSRFYLASSSVSALAVFLISLKFMGSSAAVKSRPFSLVEKLLLAAIALAAVSVLPLALLPPSVRDELIQHLAVPKMYLSRHSIFQISFMNFSYLPQNIDLLYAIPLSFGNDVIPKLIHMGFAALTGLAIYFYLLEITGRPYALLGMLLYISTPLVINLSRAAYADNGAAFYSALGMMAALKYNERPSARWLMYSAVSIGLAMSSKYNTLISLFLIGAFIMYSRARSGGNSSSIRAGALFILAAFLVLSPWLVRNYLWTGSPFYPLYENVGVSASKGEGFHITAGLSPVAKRFALYNEGILDIILLPLRIFFEGQDNSIEKFDGVLNPFYLLFLPLAFIRKSRPEIKCLAAFSILFFLIAFFTVDLVTRYLLPAMPAVIILAVTGVKNLIESKRWRTPAVTLVILLFTFDILYTLGLYRRYEPLAYLAGREGRDVFLSRVLPDYEAISYANRNLPEGSKVMLLFTGDRVYYWERDCYYGDRLGNVFKGLVKTSGDEGALKDKFRGLGITHLFIHEPLFEKYANDNFNETELKTLVRFFEGHTSRLHASGGFSIYAMN